MIRGCPGASGILLWALVGETHRCEEYFAAHSLPLVVFGTLILWFGWCPGSTVLEALPTEGYRGLAIQLVMWLFGNHLKKEILLKFQPYRPAASPD